MISPPVPLALGLGPSELLIILAVIVLLFGASKLPELARGSGRAIRIFKAETKGVLDDDSEEAVTPEIENSQRKEAPPAQPQKERPADTES